MKRLKMTMSEQRRLAVNARWGGRGKSRLIRIDCDVAADLMTIPERHRRRVATAGVRAAVTKYYQVAKNAK